MHQPAQRKLTSQNTCKRIQREEDRESPFFFTFFFSFWGWEERGRDCIYFKERSCWCRIQWDDNWFNQTLYVGKG